MKTERIFCVGRNYHAHIRELSDAVPDSPVIFSKPPTSLVPAEQSYIPYPRNSKKLHHEVEVVVRIGKEGIPTNEKEALEYVDALAIGLDLTLRDVQSGLIAKSLPWEKCKGFDFSAPIGNFFPYGSNIALDNLEFGCKVNGQVRQQGNTSRMIFPIPVIILDLAKYWKLLPGDLIYTGTPEGIGALEIGDTIEISSPLLGTYSWQIV